MVFNLFNRKKERRLALFSEKLGHAFSKIRSEVGKVSVRLENNQKELERLALWISYIHENQQRETLNQQKTVISHDSTSKKWEEKHKWLENQHKQLNVRVNSHNELHSLHASTKQDVDSLKSWISYFSSTISSQKDEENGLRKELQTIRSNVSSTLEKYSDCIEILQKENKLLKERLDDLKNAQKTLSSPNLGIQSESQPSIMPQNTNYFEQHVIRKARPNRKGYVMRFILDLVSENKYSTKEVEDIVVKEKQLCGRTSFYAYIKELKYRGKINSAMIDERSIIVAVDKL